MDQEIPRALVISTFRCSCQTFPENVNWREMMYTKCGGTIPWTGILAWIKRRKGERDLSASILIPSASCSTGMWVKRSHRAPLSRRLPATMPFPRTTHCAHSVSQKRALLSSVAPCQVFSHSKEKGKWHHFPFQFWRPRSPCISIGPAFCVCPIQPVHRQADGRLFRDLSCSPRLRHLFFSVSAMLPVSAEPLCIKMFWCFGETEEPLGGGDLQDIL